MTTTPGEIVNLALLDSGVLGQGQIASGPDTANAFKRLNFMVASWNRKRWLIYNLVDTIIPSTGAISYSVGTGGDFNIPRPDRLEDGCYLRQQESPDNVDYPLQLLTSHEDYNRIRLKNTGTFPQYVFYDSGFPLGLAYFWPVPQAATYQLNILTKNAISAFTSLGQVIQLPDEYQAALLYNLQVRLRAAYRLPPDPVIIGLAKDALNVIRNANTQIPTRRMPSGVMTRRFGYNVYSDDA